MPVGRRDVAASRLTLQSLGLMSANTDNTSLRTLRRVVGLAALVACQHARPRALPDPAFRLAGSPLSVLDPAEAAALRCQRLAKPTGSTRALRYYLCIAGDTLGPGPETLALTDLHGHVLQVTKAWFGDDSVATLRFRRLLGELEARFGPARSCATGARLWLDPSWKMELEIMHLVTPLHGSPLQISVDVRRPGCPGRAKQLPTARPRITQDGRS